MNLIYLNLVVLIFSQSVLSLEDYFKNSIIRTLRDKKLEFTSEINFKSENSNYIFRESYSFNLRSGIFGAVDRFGGKKFAGDTIYLDNGNEIYQMPTQFNHCDSKRGDDDLIKKFQWIAVDKIDRNKFITLGPNSVFFYLFDTFDTNKEIIKCENLNDSNRTNSKKCTIEKKLLKIEYYFEDKDGFTMYPLHFKTFERHSANAKWKLTLEFKYLSFVPNFNSKSPTVNLNLPIAKPCARINQDKYPKITNYYDELKLNSNVKFNFVNQEQKLEKLEYSNTISIKRGHNLNLNDVNHEINGLKIRTFYNSETGIYYDDYLNDKICKRYRQKSEDQINWYYIGNLFSIHPEFFFTEKINKSSKNYSYIGEYKLDGIDTIVFENTFSNVNKKENSTSNDRNKNNFYSNFIISTHYYPKDPKHWQHNPLNQNIPLKIELRFFDNRSYFKKEIGNLTIEFTDFKPILMLEEFEMSKCIEHLNLANHSDVTFTFNGTVENINIIKDRIFDVDRHFRRVFIPQAAPNRIADIHIKTDDKLLNINFKLFDPVDTRSYFEEDNSLSFTNQGKLYKNMELDKCSRYCVGNQNCASYSYNKLMKTCNLWIDDNFDINMKEHGNYDWNKLSLKSDKNSVVGKRLSRYVYVKHASNNEIFTFVKQLINRFKLYFVKDARLLAFNFIDLKVTPRNDD